MITIIQTNINNKDFQSMIYETDISWEDFKKRVTTDTKTIFVGSKCGDAAFGKHIKTNIDDDFHLEVVRRIRNDDELVKVQYYLVEGLRLKSK